MKVTSSLTFGRTAVLCLLQLCETKTFTSDVFLYFFFNRKLRRAVAAHSESLGSWDRPFSPALLGVGLPAVTQMLSAPNI